MKIPKSPISQRFRLVSGLASAAVILTLTACDADSLSVIQSDLADDGVNVNLTTNDDGDLVVSLIEDDDAVVSDDAGSDDGDAAGTAPGSFQVTFYNHTYDQLMTPPVVALHDPSVHLFQVGQPASDEIQVIAEMGNNAPLVEFANNNPAVVSAAGVAGNGPFAAGESVSLNLTTTQSGQVFSAVNMIICTNDGISGADSIALPSGNEPVFVMARPYDAGTRVNQNNSYSFFPPPCRTTADGVLVDVQEAPLESPRAAIGPHVGQFRTVNTPFLRNWDFNTDSDVLIIEIVRTDSTDASGDDDAMVAMEHVSFSLDSNTTVPPANVDGASGHGSIYVDTTSGAVSGMVMVSGVTGTPTAAHIHAGAPGEAGPVVIGLESNGDGTIWSVPEGAHLDADALALFEAGNLYVNVHTVANAPGELRGQLVNDDAPVAAGSLTVTLTNTSPYQPMTPPVVVLHNAPDSANGVRLFESGQPAIDQVVAIAENGNNMPLVELVESLEGGPVSAFAVGFADPDAPGPLLPGNSATVHLDLASADQVMSIVSMVVCTNDGFSGADSHTLSADASETFTLPIYDAGSETNVLMANYWVPPCSADGVSDNLTDNENGSVTLHPGQDGSENPNFDFESGSRYLEVTITRN